MVTWLFEYPLVFGAATVLVAAGFAFAMERFEHRHDREDDDDAP